MRKTGIIGVIVIIILGGAVGGWYAWKHQDKNKPASSSDTSTSNTDSDTMNMDGGSSAQGGTQTPAATNTVTVENFAFSPASITVKKGTKVTWTNKDSVAHTVTENDGQVGPTSNTLSPNASYSFTFTKTGTFQYHCSFHPSMTGTVTVTD